MAPNVKKFTLNWVGSQAQKLGSDPLTIKVQQACSACRLSPHK